MMEIYGVVVIILLIVASYVAGMATANWYHAKAEFEKKHALELQYMRLKAGTDYNDPSGPYLSPAYAGRTIRKGFTPAQMNEFEARLKNNRSATVMLNNNPTTK